jgi:hypothetical protein
VSSDGSVVYQDAMDDPGFQQDFGIGPGCESASGRAVPPVRLRELADAFALDDWRNMYSICDGDYSEVLEPIAETLVGHVRPGCMPMCVADTDASTPEVVDPSCVLLQSAPNVTGAPADVEVPRCEPGDALPAGHDVCHVLLVGDERSDYCADSGFNLEFQLVRREGVHVLPGTEVRASCEASASKAVDCPGLP